MGDGCAVLVQMNNLRVSQLERNKEILLIKRQLLLQEVNNVLLQAHITRRETELYQYREARRQGTTVRRWNTFSAQVRILHGLYHVSVEHLLCPGRDPAWSVSCISGTPSLPRSE